MVNNYFPSFAEDLNDSPAAAAQPWAEPVVFTIGLDKEVYKKQLVFSARRKYFNGYMYNLKQPLFLIVKKAARHSIFTSKFGGPRLVMDHPRLVQTLQVILELTKETLFQTGEEKPEVKDPKAFFKLEAGFEVYAVDGQKVPVGYDFKRACHADFVLCVHGAYLYNAPWSGKATVKLSCKASQMRITEAAAAPQTGSRFTFGECIL